MCCSYQIRPQGGRTRQYKRATSQKAAACCSGRCLLQLRRLFLRSRPKGGGDGTGLEGLTGRGGGRASSLRRAVGRLGWRGRGGPVTSCQKKKGCASKPRREPFASITNRRRRKKSGLGPTSSGLGGLWVKRKETSKCAFAPKINK